MLLLVPALLWAASASQGDIQATGNPYDANTCSAAECRCPALDINPLHVVRTPLNTQPGTHVATVKRRLFGIETPVYVFQQSPHLTPSPLRFKVLPLSDIDETGVVDIPVDDPKALDSWFPGFKWSIIVCARGDKWTHLGWRFRPAGVAEAGAPPSGFFALIVDYNDEKNAHSVRVAARSSEPIDISVGIPAPDWMVAMAATVSSLSPGTARGGGRHL